MGSDIFYLLHFGQLWLPRLAHECLHFTTGPAAPQMDVLPSKIMYWREHQQCQGERTLHCPKVIRSVSKRGIQRENTLQPLVPANDTKALALM